MSSPSKPTNPGSSSELDGELDGTPQTPAESQDTSLEEEPTSLGDASETDSEKGSPGGSSTDTATTDNDSPFAPTSSDKYPGLSIRLGETKRRLFPDGSSEKREDQQLLPDFRETEIMNQSESWYCESRCGKCSQCVLGPISDSDSNASTPRKYESSEKCSKGADLRRTPFSLEKEETKSPGTGIPGGSNGLSPEILLEEIVGSNVASKGVDSPQNSIASDENHETTSNSHPSLPGKRDFEDNSESPNSESSKHGKRTKSKNS